MPFCIFWKRFSMPSKRASSLSRWERNSLAVFVFNDDCFFHGNLHLTRRLLIQLIRKKEMEN